MIPIGSVPGRELINWINEVGFLPLFANEVSGFSAEEHVSPLFWCALACRQKVQWTF